MTHKLYKQGIIGNQLTPISENDVSSVACNSNNVSNKVTPQKQKEIGPRAFKEYKINIGKQVSNILRM